MKQKLYWLLYMYIITLLAFKPTIDQAALSKVLQSIDKLHTFQADFIYESSAPNDEEKVLSIEGKIWVKDNKYRLLLDEQEIICNGRIIWNYLPQAQEVQINAYDPEQEALDPIKLLTSYRTGFIPVNLQTKQIDKYTCDVLELTALDPENTIQKVILAINKKKRTIQRLEALDTDQCWHSFQIMKLEVPEKLPDHLFEFNIKKYPKIEVIDLR